jgi:hypothetical protein
MKSLISPHLHMGGAVHARPEGTMCPRDCFMERDSDERVLGAVPQDEMVEPMFRVHRVSALHRNAGDTTDLFCLARRCVDQHYACLKSVRDDRDQSVSCVSTIKRVPSVPLDEHKGH